MKKIKKILFCICFAFSSYSFSYVIQLDSITNQTTAPQDVRVYSSSCNRFYYVPAGETVTVDACHLVRSSVEEPFYLSSLSRKTGKKYWSYYRWFIDGVNPSIGHFFIYREIEMPGIPDEVNGWTIGSRGVVSMRIEDNGIRLIPQDIP